MIHASLSDPSHSPALKKSPVICGKISATNIWKPTSDTPRAQGCPFGYVPQSLVFTSIALLMGWLLTSLAVSSPDSLKIHFCLSAVNIKLILNKEMEQPLSPGDVFLGHTLFPAPAAPPQLPPVALHSGFPGEHRSFPALCYPTTSPLLTAVLSEGRVTHRRQQNTCKSSSIISRALAAPSYSQWAEERSCSQTPIAPTHGAETSGCFLQLWLHDAVLSTCSCTTQTHHSSHLSVVVQGI